MRRLISLKCSLCGKEIALISCEEFEVISSEEEFNYSEALGWYYIGYCRECALESEN